MLTPPNDAGILEGITRDAVIGLAREMGIDVREIPADQARRVYRRRVFFDGHGGRGGAGGDGRQPHDRRRRARPDHPRADGPLPRIDAKLSRPSTIVVVIAGAMHATRRSGRLLQPSASKETAWIGSRSLSTSSSTWTNTLISSSKTTALDLLDPVCDHLLRDGVGGDAVFAGRFAVVRGRAVAAQGIARSALAVPASQRRGHRRRHGQLLDRRLYRAPGLQRRNPLPEEGIPRSHPRLLREIRRQDDHHRPLRPHRPHVCPLRGRHRGDELRQVHRLQRRRRRRPGWRCSSSAATGSETGSSSRKTSRWSSWRSSSSR